MLTTRVQTITPEIASEYLKKNTLNRPINKITVGDYASQMEKGLWKLNGEPIIISSTGNVIDGQHRLSACVNSGKSFDTLVVEGVDASVFDTIDTGRIRTLADIFNIMGVKSANRTSSVISAYFNLKKSNVNMNIDNTSLRRLKHSKQELYKFYEANYALVNRIIELASKCYDKVRLMSHAQVGAYALYLILDKKHAEEKVFSFFTELFGITPSTNKAVAVAHDVLLRNITGQNVLTPTMKTAYIIKAWNYYVTGKEVKQLCYQKVRDAYISFI